MRGMDRVEEKGTARREGRGRVGMRERRKRNKRRVSLDGVSLNSPQRVILGACTPAFPEENKREKVE